MSSPNIENQLSSQAEAKHSSGMPQLDFSTYPSQIVWLVISLVVLFTVLRAYVIPRLGGLMAARGEKIDSLIEQAADLAAQATALRADVVRLEQESSLQCAEILDKARKDIAQEMLEASRKADAMIAEKTAIIHKEISDLQQKTAAFVEEITLDISASIVKKMTDQDLTKETASSLVMQAVT